MTRALCLLVALAAACSKPASSASQDPTAAGNPGEPGPIRAKRDTAEMLGTMAQLAGLVPDRPYLVGWAQKIDSGQSSITNYIDELLGTERFANEIVPSLVFGAFVNVRNYYALPSAFVLKRAADGSGPLYLREPCRDADAVAVHPWWNLKSEVRVCADAYRPEKWTINADEHSYKTRAALSCDSQVGSPELETKSLCGCGPNLIRCMRDEDQYNQFNKSFMDEVKRTTAYVVNHDLPMTTLFTGTSTYRDANAELYYRRQKIGAMHTAQIETELADLDSWPAVGKWAPREELKPGQHAGLLTAPQILHWLPDQRQRQRGYYEVMWCNMRNSFGATTKRVLELNHSGNNFFVHDSWQKLAHTELCMNCHARLDYGSQFFQGYPDSRASTHYNPELQTTDRGPLYGQDINDVRGEAPLTPAGFGALATSQPDFAGCMATHFVDYVLGDRATPDDVTAIETAVTTTGTFKQPMKVALERFAAKWGAEATEVAPAAVAEPGFPLPPPMGAITIGPELRAELDRRCVDCHDEPRVSDVADTDDLPYDFRTPQLPRRLVVKMTDLVAFGMMPKDGALDTASRQRLVTQLVDALWTDPAARAEAQTYYLGQARGFPAHQLDNALYSIDQVAGAEPNLGWGALERGIWADQTSVTPDFLAITGLEAVRACTRAAQAGSKIPIEDCLARATSLKALSRWTP